MNAETPVVNRSSNYAGPAVTMNAKRLLDQFARIADTPDAIPRLRRFVLDLAVRGKLVPQDPNDESASELLKRIAAEKARLVKAGEIRSPKLIRALSEPPFPIPMNWCWSQIAEIGVLNPRNVAPDTTDASFVPMPLIAAEYGVANDHEIRPWGEIKKGYTHFAEGDVGLAKITPCFENGKSTVFRNLTGSIGSGTTELHIVRPLFVDQDYILIFFKSPRFIKTGIPKMTGTAGQKRVPTEYFVHSPFPLPPLAEQHRIVAKVDELMAPVRPAGGGAGEARGDARPAGGGEPRPPQRARSRNLPGRRPLRPRRAAGPHHAPRPDQAPPPDHPQPRRARQTRAARPERRTGVGTAEADRQEASPIAQIGIPKPR